VLNPKSKNKKVMVACLILIVAFNPVAIAPGTDLCFIVDNPAAHLSSITEKPRACAQRSNNERRRQIVSPKKNRRGD
jgi:hypothetical protein